MQRLGVIPPSWGFGAGATGLGSGLRRFQLRARNVAADSVFTISGIATEYVGHVAIAVTLLGRQKMAPAIEARVDGGVRWQVVIGVCRWVVAGFVGIGGKDRKCRWTTCRSALEPKCALRHIADVPVPGHAAPTARATINIHERTLGQIENKFGLCSGRPPKRNIGGGLPDRGERVPALIASATTAASTLVKAAHASPPSLCHLGTSTVQFHQGFKKLAGINRTLCQLRAFGCFLPR